MYSKLKYIVPFLVITFLFSSTQALSHSGRTDSSGGHNCNVGSCAGSYHYHNGGSAYTPPARTYTYSAPKCDKPDISDTQGRPSFVEVDCKQNVTFTWDKAIGDNQYSVALSKTAGADPGPTADTYSRSMTFKGISPGKWFVNVKAGNSCGWGSVHYWDIEVPKINLVINRFSADKQSNGVSELKFDAKCGSSYSISPGVGYLTQSQIEKGYVVVTPTKDTTYTLTVAGNGQTKKSTVSVTAPTPTPTPKPTPTIEPVIDEATEEVEEPSELIEDNQPTSEQGQNSFWDTLFNNEVILTFARLLIFNF